MIYRPLKLHRKILAALKRFLKALLHEFLLSRKYKPLSRLEFEREGVRLANSWKNTNIPHQQLKLTRHQIKKHRDGSIIPEFNALTQGLKCLTDCTTLLEIGCSTGYYSEILEISDIPFKYTGCDYSEAFIDIAKVLYPSNSFHVEDNNQLSYSDNSFDIVISGCCILHISDFEKAIYETIRVAKKFIVFHRTPVVAGTENKFYKKNAYGVETIEIHFSESMLLNLLDKSGLDIIDVATISEEEPSPNQNNIKSVRTYFCKKRTDV